MKEVTTLRGGWRKKMFIFIAAFLAFGAWGYYDATIAYPRRGLKIASIRELEYLQQAQRQTARLSPEAVSIPDPRERLDSLEHSKDRNNTLDQARLAWLDALSKAWRLTPDRTTYNNSDREPVARMKELDAQIKASPGLPKALDALDIPTQWLICIGCWGFALLGIAWMLRFSLRRYTWDPDEKRLGFPDGNSITPADLEEVDKTKWSKYWVKLRIKQSHPKLGGKSVDIDLYRRGKIEGWILEMEKAAGLNQDGVEVVEAVTAPAPVRADDAGSPPEPAADAE